MTIIKYEAIYFSSASYIDNAEDFNLDQSYKDAGWTKLTDSDKLGLNTDGYYATSYVKIVNGTVTDIVIAHRGTESLPDLVVDGQIVTDGLIPNDQVDNAKNFTDLLRDEYYAKYGDKVNFDSITTQTGHSLGGYLAIHAADYQTTGSGESIKAITFDNPKTGLISTDADIETYLNPPNWVNATGNGEHLGDVYRLKSDLAFGNNEVIATI